MHCFVQRQLNWNVYLKCKHIYKYRSIKFYKLFNENEHDECKEKKKQFHLKQ